MQFNYFTYREESVICPSCGWQGKGWELSHGDFSYEHFIMDLDCPKCFEHLGFWQSPMQTEMDEWRRTHPNWTGEADGPSSPEGV